MPSNPLNAPILEMSPAPVETSAVAVIGSGPAGITAALQLARMGISTVLFERGEIGGLIRCANLVENYPGFPQGVSGLKLARLFKRQLARHPVTVRHEAVVGLGFNDGLFTVKTSTRRLRCRFVVLATGTRPRRGLEDLCDLPRDRRIIYDIIPLLEMRGKTILIIGAGDAAFDYALNLARFHRISIFNRGSVRKCLPILWERQQSYPSISYSENAQLMKVQSRTEGLVCVFRLPDGEMEVKGDYLVSAIGREPETDLLSGLSPDEIAEWERCGHFYRIGDLANGDFRQVGIAVGDGLQAAMNIHRKLGRE